MNRLAWLLAGTLGIAGICIGAAETGAAELEEVAFTEVAEQAGVDGQGSSTYGVAWGDYDNDGDLDLAQSGGETHLYRNAGDGSFTNVARSSGIDYNALGRDMAWGDYDGDGDLDLYLTTALSQGDETHANRLYRNAGDGTFVDVAPEAGVDDQANSIAGNGAIWGDFDDDGDLDLYLANWFGVNRLYRNDGDETFTDIAYKAGVDNGQNNRSQAAVWTDFDNDGDLDLHVATSGQDLLYRNEADGTFTNVAASAGIEDRESGMGPAWGDFDNDGDPDLYLAKSTGEYAGPNRLFRNNGNGSFTDVAPVLGLADESPGFSAAWADYDSDGDLDLYLANFGSQNRLYRNEGTPNHWLNVKLVGTTSSRDGIGARVTAVSGALRQRRDVDGGSGSYSQPSLPVEFGLGGETAVDSLIVRWPSGIVQILIDVAADQFLVVKESSPGGGMARPLEPALVSPVDAATDLALESALSWDAAAGAAGYEVQVGDASDFVSLLVHESGLVETSLLVSDLAYGTTYYLAGARRQ